MGEIKETKNRKEKNIGLVYVTVLFLITSIACCWCLHYYADDKTETRKEFVIGKMDRIQEFQTIQSKQIVIIDSIYNKIRLFDPGINASYEENDIKFYLNDIKRLYDDHIYDGRYKVFDQLSSFYQMWFADRKELWSKQQNVIQFNKNLEDCRIGLEKKQAELQNVRRK